MESESDFGTEYVFTKKKSKPVVVAEGPDARGQAFHPDAMSWRSPLPLLKVGEIPLEKKVCPLY